MNTTESILVVDDDHEIRSLLGEYLTKFGYKVHLASNAAQARSALETVPIDLIVLDVMMPGEDGIGFLTRLRQGQPERRELPVLMLTARNDPVDRILGLEVGADDYLPKPFVPRELLARVKAVLKRVNSMPLSLRQATGGGALRFDGWVLDLTQRRLSNPQGEEVTLTGMEFQILRILVEYPERIFSREQLLELSRGREMQPYDRSVDVMMSRIRQHLGDDGKSPRYIKTVRNQGYIFSASVQRV